MISSDIFSSFIAAVERAELEVYGIEIYEHGEKRACHRWREDVPVNIWSHTKCFTSAAVGLAIAEKRLSLEQPIVTLFPEYAECNPSPQLQELTLRHVLTMSSGQRNTTLFGPLRDDPQCQIETLPRDADGNPEDLLVYSLSQPFVEPSGVNFSYSNADAGIAARCVERAVGMTLRSYLYDRLLRHLDIPYPHWHCDLRGHTYGDAGLYLKTSDMVKLGLLYCQNGEWNGRQLMPAEWIRESTARQIDTPVRDPWDCGYGYLIWKFPVDDGYRFAGIGGQNTIVLPHKGIVIGMNANVGQRLGELKQIVTETIINKL